MIQVVGLITARGGSKGIPRKNIKTLAGKPLIAWTIEAALQSQRMSRVIDSTDRARQRKRRGKLKQAFRVSRW